MSRNPQFERLLQDLLALHDRKNADYASADDPTSNFTYAASLANGFTDPADRVFATLIGVKLARIQELTKPGRAARNESLDDSFKDLANYAAIWAARRIAPAPSPAPATPTTAETPQTPASTEPSPQEPMISAWTQTIAWTDDKPFGKFPTSRGK